MPTITNTESFNGAAERISRLGLQSLWEASDPLAHFLTDRVARYSDAVEAVNRARAQDLPLVVIGLLHDGPGPPLPKRKTR